MQGDEPDPRLSGQELGSWRIQRGAPRLGPASSPGGSVVLNVAQSAINDDMS